MDRDEERMDIRTKQQATSSCRPICMAHTTKTYVVCRSDRRYAFFCYSCMRPCGKESEDA